MYSMEERNLGEKYFQANDNHNIEVQLQSLIALGHCQIERMSELTQENPEPKDLKKVISIMGRRKIDNLEGWSKNFVREYTKSVKVISVDDVKTTINTALNEHKKTGLYTISSLIVGIAIGIIIKGLV